MGTAHDDKKNDGTQVAGQGMVDNAFRGALSEVLYSWNIVGKTRELGKLMIAEKATVDNVNTVAQLLGNAIRNSENEAQILQSIADYMKNKNLDSLIQSLKSLADPAIQFYNANKNVIDAHCDTHLKQARAFVSQQLGDDFKDQMEMVRKSYPIGVKGKGINIASQLAGSLIGFIQQIGHRKSLYDNGNVNAALTESHQQLAQFVDLIKDVLLIRKNYENVNKIKIPLLGEIKFDISDPKQKILAVLEKQLAVLVSEFPSKKSIPQIIKDMSKLLRSSEQQISKKGDLKDILHRVATKYEAIVKKNEAVNGQVIAHIQNHQVVLHDVPVVEPTRPRR